MSFKFSNWLSFLWNNKCDVAFSDYQYVTILMEVTHDLDWWLSLRSYCEWKKVHVEFQHRNEEQRSYECFCLLMSFTVRVSIEVKVPPLLSLFVDLILLVQPFAVTRIVAVKHGPTNRAVIGTLWLWSSGYRRGFRRSGSSKGELSYDSALQVIPKCI